MKLSTRARYALRMMLDVAKHEGGRPVSLTTVAERSGLSHGYMEQLAVALRAAGLLVGVSGRHGGYHLARPPSKISICDIVEATIGPVSIAQCIADPASCERHEGCECRMLYTLINYRIAEVLHAYTLADLMDSSWIEAFTSKVDELTALPACRSPAPRGKKREVSNAH
jgi:Rrf2 family protein